MARIVMASKSSKLLSLLKPLLISNGYDLVAITDNPYELSRQVKAWSPQIVIIDDEISNIGVSFVESLIFDQQAVLFMGKAYQRGYFHTSPYLEFCDKPIQPNIFLMTLRLLSKYAMTVKQLESKITKLEEKQKNDKLIGQAKRKLQLHKGYSEDEAHLYIQKRSMELRISKAELSKRILKIFTEKA